jgi:hypothetical protein
MQVQRSCVVFRAFLSLWKEGRDGPSHDTESYHLLPKECLHQVVNGTMFLRHWAWGTDTFLPLRCS